MVRAVDVLSIGLMLLAVGAFSMGVLALGDRKDLDALYWLVVGGLMLRASTDMLKPKSGR